MAFLALLASVTAAEPSPVAESTAMPLRAGISLVGTGGVSLARMSLGGAPGVAGELGAMLTETVAFSIRGMMATVGVFTSLSIAAGVDLVMSDQLLLGFGLAHGGFGLVDGAGTTWLGASARVLFTPVQRGPSAVGRFALFFEVTPAASLQVFPGLSRGPNTGPPIAITSSLGAGFAWW